MRTFIKYLLHFALLLSLVVIFNLQASAKEAEPGDLQGVSSTTHSKDDHHRHHYTSHNPAHYEKLSTEIKAKINSVSEANDVFTLASELQFQYPRNTVKLLESSNALLLQLPDSQYLKSQQLLFQLLIKVGEVNKAKQHLKSLWSELPESTYPWLQLMEVQVDLSQQALEQGEYKLSKYYDQYVSDRNELNLWYLYIAGSLQLLKSEFDVALSLLLEASRKAKLLENGAAEVAINDQLAKLFFHTQKYQRALEFSELMLIKAQQMHDRFAEVSANANKMNIYYTMAIQQANHSNTGLNAEPSQNHIELLERSDQLAQLVIQQAESVGAHRARTWARILRQNLFLTRNDFEQALQVSEATIEYAEYHKLDFEAAISYNNMAIAYRNLEKYEASRLALKQAERIYQEMGNKQSQLWLMEDYAKLYELEGDHKQSLEYFKQYHQASLELAEARNERTLLELQEEYAASQKQLEIERLNQQALLDARQLQSERLGRWLLSVILVALIAIAFILYSKRKRLQQLLKNEARLNREITELGEAKQRFFINISHEFRTALTLSISPLRKVLQECEMSDGCQSRLEGALENNLHMLSLINEVMEVEQIRRGQMPVHLSYFSTRRAIEQSLKRFQAQFLEKNIQVITDFDTCDDVIAFDLSHFDKVIANLVSNAAKFSPLAASLHINTHVTEHAIEIIIRDQGPGIPQKELPLVFRRFYQGSHSLQQATAGSGVGLSMVYELLRLHGGNIEVSNLEQQGCCVTVTIQRGILHYPDALRETMIAHVEEFANLASPRSTELVSSFDQSVGALSTHQQQTHVQEDGVSNNIISLADKVNSAAPELVNARSEVSEKSSDSIAPSNKKFRQTILLVDDHPKVRQLLKDMLQMDYRILEAADGRQALQIARSVQPDLVISDVMMPEMDGFELTRQMRLDKELAHLSLILVTALDDKGSTLSGLTLGADDYITKPFSDEELKARVFNLLQRKQQLSEVLFQKYKSRLITQNHTVQINSQACRRKAQLEKVIAENLGQWDFDVEQMYTALNMTRSTLFRYTKETFGCSPKNLLKKRRLELAHSMLQNSQGTISEVAYAVGFQSLSTFSRAFREFYNMPPTEVARRFRSAY